MTVDGQGDLNMGHGRGRTEPTGTKIRARAEDDDVSSSCSASDAANESDSLSWDPRQLGDGESETEILQKRTYVVTENSRQVSREPAL